MRAAAVIVLAVSLTATTARAGNVSDNLSLDGYFKNFSVGYWLPEVDFSGRTVDLPPLGSVTNRLRLNARWRIVENLFFSTSYDIGPVVQDPVLYQGSPTVSLIDPFSYRVDDLDPRLYPAQGDSVASLAVFNNLDRLYLELRTNRVDFFVGRQAIAFGSARAVNPTDVLAPYTYETLDTEDRVGVDAVRARMPLGFMGEVDIGWVFGQDFAFAHSAGFVRAKFHVAQTDLAVMAMPYRENLMLGLDLTRPLGGAGVWLEAAHTFADALTDKDSPGATDFFRASLGGDYSLTDQTYGFAEYHFNQAGADDPAGYAGRLTGTAYTEGGVYLLGRHYLIPGVVHQFSPLISGTGELLWNLSDGSLYLAPSVEYNVCEDIYLAGGFFVGLGESPGAPAGVRSEFGAYPDIFYTSFRYYF